MGSLLELRKFVAPEFVFGKDARLLAGSAVKNLGAKRVLLVSDPGVSLAGWMAEIRALLEQESLQITEFTGISPNPRDFEVMAGVAVYKNNACDAIVAVGGGSVMDAAKGIGIVVTNGGHILDYEGVDKVPNPMPPLICIPTTGGTSADVSQFSIINNTTDKVKIAIISKSLVPDAALVDPVTLITLDSYLTACTGMDALVHAVEAFVSNASGPVTDLFALESIRLLHGSLSNSVREPKNLDHRGSVMLASLNAGLAFSNASLGCVHALAHSLGGLLDLPHGECNALLLPHVVAYNFEAAEDRYKKIGEILGIDGTAGQLPARRDRFVQALLALRASIGIGGSLKDRGLKTTDLSVLADKAIKDPCNATNPRRPNARDLRTILEESL